MSCNPCDPHRKVYRGCSLVLAKTGGSRQEDQHDEQEVEGPVEVRSLQVEREQGSLRSKRHAQKCLQTGPYSAFCCRCVSM